MLPEPVPIIRRRENLVFSNRFGELYDDEVEGPSGDRGNYLRWRWGARGVVVAARSSKGTLFVPAYRYPPGVVSLELPRGGWDVGESLEEAACRELLEESGYVGGQVTERGQIYPDTGLIENAVTVAEVLIAEPDLGVGEQRAEVMESVAEAVWLSDDDVLRKVANGELRCSISIAAFTMCRLAH
ncbi:8-oxo-dGTP pyrophosphatase MutT (NUDIX family) [Kribbella antiqua]|uniref:8-oxo-dGTP pyrophosphatase MutT (NUDIX family) n=1 Tax=Kribbella antiqua TaxID=2512217 RepID=A0A4V6NNH1_9ACTN|nr:NUDIX hydrolase [Kribbella antiqua]TCO43620.1 8-oxo-dGTP pyrophosphatase MutT (NUDIX family) [Kribbella antiqua]